MVNPVVFINPSSKTVFHPIVFYHSVARIVKYSYNVAARVTTIDYNNQGSSKAASFLLFVFKIINKQLFTLSDKFKEKLLHRLVGLEIYFGVPLNEHKKIAFSMVRRLDYSVLGYRVKLKAVR